MLTETGSATSNPCLVDQPCPVPEHQKTTSKLVKKDPGRSRKRFAPPARPGDGAADATVTPRRDCAPKVNDRSWANNGSAEQTRSFIRSALTSYIRCTGGLFVFAPPRSVDRFNILWKVCLCVCTSVEGECVFLLLHGAAAGLENVLLLV